MTPLRVRVPVQPRLPSFCRPQAPLSWQGVGGQSPSRGGGGGCGANPTRGGERVGGWVGRIQDHGTPRGLVAANDHGVKVVTAVGPALALFAGRIPKPVRGWKGPPHPRMKKNLFLFRRIYSIPRDSFRVEHFFLKHPLIFFQLSHLHSPPIFFRSDPTPSRGGSSRGPPNPTPDPLGGGAGQVPNKPPPKGPGLVRSRTSPPPTFPRSPRAGLGGGGGGWSDPEPVPSPNHRVWGRAGRGGGSAAQHFQLLPPPVAGLSLFRPPVRILWPISYPGNEGFCL